MFKDKYTLITGGSSGLGAGIAKEVYQAGGNVIIIARNEKKLKAVARELDPTGQRCRYYVADLGKISEVNRVVKAIKKDIAFVDIIINNAGAGKWQSIEETSMQEAEDMMRVPYFAAFNITRAFIEPMLERNEGYIVNVTSPASEFLIPGAVAYSVGRWAMRGFNQALWGDLYATNIQVSLFVAGKIDSDYFRNNPGSEEKIPGISNTIPTLSVEQAAKALVKGVIKKKSLILAPFTLKVFYFFNRYFPAISRYLTVATGYKRKR